MDIVKAVINFGEISIQLEGPRDFVEKYLDEYKSILEKGRKATTTPTKTTKGDKPGKSAPKRKGTAKSKSGPSCLGSVKNLIEEGYFKETRERADVQKHLLSKGLRFESKHVSAALNNCFSSDRLLRTGVGTHAKYYSNV